MQWHQGKQNMTLEFLSNNLFDVEPETMDFDYVVMAVPFSRVRLWSLPEYSSLLFRATNNLYYDPSCKVVLHYKTRFWEHLEDPMYRGCGYVDIPGI